MLQYYFIWLLYIYHISTEEIFIWNKLKSREVTAISYPNNHTDSFWSNHGDTYSMDLLHNETTPVLYESGKIRFPHRLLRVSQNKA